MARWIFSQIIPKESKKKDWNEALKVLAEKRSYDWVKTSGYDILFRNIFNRNL